MWKSDVFNFIQGGMVTFVKYFRLIAAFQAFEPLGPRQNPTRASAGARVNLNGDLDMAGVDVGVGVYLP